MIAMGCLACAVAGGLVVTGRIAHADPAPVLVYAQTETISAPIVTDINRRAAFEAKLQARISQGDFRRLSDAPTSRPAQKSTSRTALPVAAARIPERPEPPSTIAPPPVVGGPVHASTGRGYTPPRLDLTTPPTIPSTDVECLTQAIYYEARNESEEGQAAVAEVVLNRTRSGRYPRQVCAVVYQRNSRTCQFTFTCDGSIGRRAASPVAWARAERIAREALGGRKAAGLPDHSVNYHANYVRPSWGKRLQRVRQIGAHIFYGAPLDGGATPGQATTTAPEPSRGLMFVRNEALERAYAVAVAPPAETPDGG